MTVRLRGISNDAVPSFQFIVSALRRSWGDANNDSLVRYVRGLAAAFRFVCGPADREQVVSTRRWNRAARKSGGRKFPRDSFWN